LHGTEMNIRLLAACVVVACIPAATAAPPAWSLDAEYAAWKSLYSISYYATVAEEIARYKVWKAAAAPRSWGEPSLSPYADRTLEEYRAIFPESFPGNSSRSATTPAAPPSYPFTAFSDAYVAKAKEAGIDWREKGVVTPCKSQGPHGVCGTFGQTQDAESSRAIGGGGANPNKRPHTAVQFSEQQLLSCKGKAHQDSYFFFEVGVESSQDYPFNLSNWPDNDPPPCHLDKSKIIPDTIFTNITTVPPQAGEDQLAAFIFHNGPVQSGINAGVFAHVDKATHHVNKTGCAAFTGKSIDHSIGVVGFGTDAATGGDYWIIKNSWGNKWQDHGFIYLARGVRCGNFFSAGAHVYTYGPEHYYYEQSRLGVGGPQQ